MSIECEKYKFFKDTESKQVSDIEKTLIDFVYFKEPFSKEVLNEIKQRIDKKKLNEYLKRIPKHVRKRIEFIL